MSQNNQRLQENTSDVWALLLFIRYAIAQQMER